MKTTRGNSCNVLLQSYPISILDRGLTEHVYCIKNQVQKRPKRITYHYLLYRQECFLKNTPLVKFIRNYIRDPSGVFSISSLVKILMTSFPTLLLVRKIFSLPLKNKIHIFALPWNILCVHLMQPYLYCSTITYHCLSLRPGSKVELFMCRT